MGSRVDLPDVFYPRGIVMTEGEAQELSPAAFERLRSELDELQTTGRADMAARLQRARELGDLSENAEYHETKHQQGLMEARIRKLEHLLQNAVVVEAPSGVDHAAAGMIVTLRSIEGGESERYLLAASNEERHPEHHTVTVGSPLGTAIVGKRVGEKVEYTAPGGTFSYEIVALAPRDA
ncbi:MAG TPA: transcription elongation factor GreA [Actinomycetota bacterium]